MKKLLFLINPVSGKMALRDDLMAVIEVFSKADYEINVYLTKSEDDMKEQVVSRGADFDLVVCCGGDGTLNMVVGTVYEHHVDTTVGYIPGGTTNDFANTRHIDTYVVGAAKQICEGMVRDIDLGVLNGHPFVYVRHVLRAVVSYHKRNEAEHGIRRVCYGRHKVSGKVKAL